MNEVALLKLRANKLSSAVALSKGAVGEWMSLTTGRHYKSLSIPVDRFYRIAGDWALEN